MSDPITTYKGFKADWTCRDFQYAVGQEYEIDGKIHACKNGFHACEYPLDVLSYYSPAQSKFAVVEQSGELSKKGDDSKVASTKIRVVAEINFAGLIKTAIGYTFARALPVDPNSPASATGTQAAASATGTQAAASATGDYAAASATGYQSAASATGDYAAALATGYQSAASATGTKGAASATGEKSVAMACGFEGRAMGVEGGAIFLVHRDDEGNIIHARGSKVGDNGIKPNVFYTLRKDGNFVEVTGGSNE